jgi:hypothetical protein
MGQKLGLTRLSEPAPADPTDVLRLECHANVPSLHWPSRRRPDTGEWAQICAALNQ